MEPQVRRVVVGAGTDGAVGIWFDGPSRNQRADRPATA